jgi:hypothetical protein
MFAVLGALWDFVKSLFEPQMIFWLVVVAFAYWTAWKNSRSIRQRKWWQPTWPWAALFLLAFAGRLHAQTQLQFAMRNGVGIVYPNPTLTPGVVATSDTAVVCHRTTKAVRHTTEATKTAVYHEYGIATHSTGQYEIDHLIPLELGGADTIANLWPEPATPLPGFHQKDALENELHRLACRGQVRLDSAQAWIAHDWYAAYRDFIGGPKRAP